MVDGLHGNIFSKAEVSAFLAMIRDRGYDVEVLGEPDPFGQFEGGGALGEPDPTASPKASTPPYVSR